MTDHHDHGRPGWFWWNRVKLRPPPVRETLPFAVENASIHAVQVWKNGNGPVMHVAPGETVTIDGNRHGGLPSYGTGSDTYEAKVVDSNRLSVVVATWIPTPATCGASSGLVIKVTCGDMRRVDALLSLRASGLLPRALRVVRDEIRKRRDAAMRLAALGRGVCARALRECPVCCDHVVAGAFVRPAQACLAKHAFCRPCARTWLATQIDDGRLILKCPGGGCSTLLSNRDIDTLASVKLVAKLRSKIVESNERRLVDLASEAASADDRDFAAWATRACRACPNCKVLIYRYAGCDHMTCKCGETFNWGASNVAVAAASDALAADPDSEAPARWTCPQCTFHNNPALPRCEICRANRPPAPAWAAAP